MRACSMSEQDSHIPLDRRTFLRWLSRWWRGQHESGSPSFSISPPRAEAPFLLSFGVVLAPAAGSTAYSESADVLAAKYLRLNQTIGSGGIGATLQTYCSATEEEWKVERRRPSRGRT